MASHRSRLGWFSPSRGGHLLQAVAVGWVMGGGEVPCRYTSEKRKKKKFRASQPPRRQQKTPKNFQRRDRKFRLLKQKIPKSKEQREKREQREEEREFFLEEMRGERNFRNKYQLVRWGLRMKNIDFLIFTKCTVAFHF